MVDAAGRRRFSSPSIGSAIRSSANTIDRASSTRCSTRAGSKGSIGPRRFATDDIVEELQAKFQPDDISSIRKGTADGLCRHRSPVEFARKRVQVIVLTGIHLDWCIEGIARAARDYRYLPIVIGDATATQKPEQAKGGV